MMSGAEPYQNDGRASAFPAQVDQQEYERQLKGMRGRALSLCT